jgi:hypothetical protein
VLQTPSSPLKSTSATLLHTLQNLQAQITQLQNSSVSQDELAELHAQLKETLRVNQDRGNKQDCNVNATLSVRDGNSTEDITSKQFPMPIATNYNTCPCTTYPSANTPLLKNSTRRPEISLVDELFFATTGILVLSGIGLIWYTWFFGGGRKEFERGKEEDALCRGTRFGDRWRCAFGGREKGRFR